MEERAKRVPGVTDAKVDLVSMELVLDGEKLDLARVIEALKAAGVDVGE